MLKVEIPRCLELTAYTSVTTARFMFKTLLHLHQIFGFKDVSLFSSFGEKWGGILVVADFLVTTLTPKKRMFFSLPGPAGHLARSLARWQGDGTLGPFGGDREKNLGWLSPTMYPKMEIL